MRFLTARRLALAALVPALFVFSAVPGCSNESEGERCGSETVANNDDCTAPLICVSVSNVPPLLRCCDPNPTVIHDSRCVRSNTGTGGTGGTGDAGTAGTGAVSTGGTAGTAGSDAGMSDAATAGAADLGAGGN